MSVSEKSTPYPKACANHQFFGSITPFINVIWTLSTLILMEMSIFFGQCKTMGRGQTFWPEMLQIVLLVLFPGLRHQLIDPSLL